MPACDQDCGEHGTCVDTPSGGTKCKCTRGWEGPGCTVRAGASHPHWYVWIGIIGIIAIGLMAVGGLAAKDRWGRK